MKTYSPKISEIKHEWHMADASGQVLGRLATQIAVWLTGKHKATFAPHLDMGDNVVVINAEKIKVTGSKASQKKYYRHSGYPGGLKVSIFSTLPPTDVIIHAVSGMLPKNKLRDLRLKRLHVIIGSTHSYGQHFA